MKHPDFWKDISVETIELRSLVTLADKKQADNIGGCIIAETIDPLTNTKGSERT
jgi:hypothetical protein